MNFKETIYQIQSNISRFQRAPLASEVHIQKFLELIKLFQDRKVKIIFFFPPLPPSVNLEMKKYNYSYIQDLKNKLKEHEIHIYDFTEPDKVVSTNDCEFIDGFHGGDVLDAKVLLYLVGKEPFLENYIKRSYLKEVILKYSGLAMIPNPKATQNNEIDFLKKGCIKNGRLIN